LAQSKPALKSVRSQAGRLDPLAQAGRTQDFIFMLRDALPTEKPAALRTARHRFAQHVIVTMLVRKIRHKIDNPD
jgi:hypothetical protein